MAKTKKSLLDRVISSGKSLRLAAGTAAGIHHEVLEIIGSFTGTGKETKIKPQPVKWYLLRFVQEVANGVDWPKTDKNEYVGYRTIITESTKDGKKYSADLVNLAHYFNNFQSYLYSKKAVQKVKKPAVKASGGHVVNHDQILERFQQILAILETIPDEKKRKTATRHLQNAAKSGFGIAGLSL